MRRNLFLLLSCTVILLLGGCSTSVLYLDAIQPAKVPIANNQWKVVVVNRYNPDLLEFKREKKIDVFAKGGQEAFAGIVEAVLEDSTYQLVHTDNLTYQAKVAEEPFSKEQIWEIHRQHPHHLLLALDNFDISMTHETVREEDSNGAVSKTAYFTLITKASWSLFDSTGKVLDKASITHETPYQSRAVLSGLLAIGPSLANAGEKVNQLAWYTGYDYWKRLHPQPVSYARTYYVSKNVRPANVHMAKKDWQMAIILLKPRTLDQKNKHAARAAYNLAVVYEAIGDIEEARHWAREAKRKNDPLAGQLLLDLERHKPFRTKDMKEAAKN